MLTGSRARGRAGPWSDWDFAVGATAFAEVCRAMPRLVAPLRPVVAQWDRLARTWCYMLILDGPVKVDLSFAQPHPPLPPWQVSAAALPGIDDHFWDWMLWLHAKHAAGRRRSRRGRTGQAASSTCWPRWASPRRPAASATRSPPIARPAPPGNSNPDSRYREQPSKL